MILFQIFHKIFLKSEFPNSRNLISKVNFPEEGEKKRNKKSKFKRTENLIDVRK